MNNTTNKTIPSEQQLCWKHEKDERVFLVGYLGVTDDDNVDLDYFDPLKQCDPRKLTLVDIGNLTLNEGTIMGVGEYTFQKKIEEWAELETLSEMKIEKMSAGNNHVAFLTNDGCVYCWVCCIARF